MTVLVEIQSKSTGDHNIPVNTILLMKQLTAQV